MKIIAILFILLSFISPLSTLCEGFEIGDAIYNSLVIGWDTGYDHGGLIYFARPNEQDPEKLPVIYTMEALKNPGVQQGTIPGFGLEFGPYFSASDFETAKSIILMAKELEGREYVDLPPQGSFDALQPDGDWDGTPADIEKIRCDGLVQYCYDTSGAGAYYWYDDDSGYNDGIQSSLLLPFYNDLPPFNEAHNPCYFFPKSQRGAAGDCDGGGPGGEWEGAGTFMLEVPSDNADTVIDDVILGADGQDKILVYASDPSSGISYLRCSIVPSDDLDGPPPPASQWWTVGSFDESEFEDSLQSCRSLEIPAQWKAFYYFQAVDGAGNLSSVEVHPYSPLVPDALPGSEDRRFFRSHDLRELELCPYPAYDIYRVDRDSDGLEFLGSHDGCAILELLENLDAAYGYIIIGKDRYGRQRQFFSIPGEEYHPDSVVSSSLPDAIQIDSALRERSRFRSRFTGRNLPDIKTSQEAIDNPEATDLVIYSSNIAALEDADLVAATLETQFNRSSQIVLGSGNSYEECREVAQAVYGACQDAGFTREPILVIAGSFDYQDGSNNFVSAVPYDEGLRFSDNMIVDFDGDRIPEMPVTRLPIIDDPYYGVEYSQWLLARNAIGFSEMDIYSGSSIVFIDGSYHAYYEGDDRICVDNPDLTAVSQSMASMLSEQEIDCDVINPEDVDDDDGPCWPTEEKGVFIREHMTGAISEVFGIGRRSLQHISPGDFLKTTRHDTHDWPHQGYAFNLFCCKTAEDEFENYANVYDEALYMKWMLSSPYMAPYGACAVSYIGCRHSGIIGEHLALATKFVELRGEKRHLFFQELLFDVIRELASERPYMLSYLNQVVSFGWPTPIFSTYVEVTGIDEPPTENRKLFLRCHPNPFNPLLTIELKTFHPGRISIAIFDVTGRRIRTFPEFFSTGEVREIQWNGRDDQGKKQGSGVYFVRVRAGNSHFSRKVILLK